MNKRSISLFGYRSVIIGLFLIACASLRAQDIPEGRSSTSQEKGKISDKEKGVEGMRAMSPTERLWRANYHPERLPRELRGSMTAPEGKSATFAALAASTGLPGPDDNFWVSILPDQTDDDVFALAMDGGTLYAGGAFRSIGGTRANGIGFWNGSEWQALDDGSGVGVQGFVFAIAIAGSKIYVAGQFTRAGGIAANNIAVWDKGTKTWSALGDGVTGNGQDIPFISSIEIHGNDVYVAGSFSKAGGTAANNIAQWNNGTWTSLGSGINGAVNALAFFNNNLYAGGSFTGAGDINSNGIALWNGDSWEDLAGGVNGYVNEIRVSGDSGIVVGGKFSVMTEEATFAQNIAWWSGTWINRGGLDPFGAPGELITIAGEVRAIVVDGRDMWVGGLFDDAAPRGAGAESGPLNNITLFNDQPATWFKLPNGVNGSVNALVKRGAILFAGGSFTQADAKNANRLAQWDTLKRRWTGVEPPTALAPIRAMALQNKTLYAAGSFTDQEPGIFNTINHLAMLTPKGWKLIDGDIQGSIYTMASTPDQLIIGGSFITSDELITVNVARWNSTTKEWSPLTSGSGVAGLDDISYVTAILPQGDNIYIGGQFGIADTTLAANIAVWNQQTQTWKSMGEGLDARVWTIVTDPQGTIYAGGEFTYSGNKTINGVARWDGTEWQPLGGGIEGKVLALLVADGKLYVGGTFKAAGGIGTTNVAQWDIASQQWHDMGAGLNSDFEPAVYALAYNKGRVFAAGKFEVSGSDSISNIARWNPGGWWEKLGSGADRVIQSLVVDEEDNDMYVGGYFLLAGAKDSPYTALWRDPTLSVDDGPSSPVTGEILSAGQPNPFTTEATLHFLLPEGKNRSVSIVLCDVTGRIIQTILDEELPAGEHQARIQGEDLPAGVYFLRLHCGERTESISLIKQ